MEMRWLFSIPAECKIWLWNKYMSNSCERWTNQTTKSRNLSSTGPSGCSWTPGDNGPWPGANPCTRRSWLIGYPESFLSYIACGFKDLRNSLFHVFYRAWTVLYRCLTLLKDVYKAEIMWGLKGKFQRPSRYGLGEGMRTWSYACSKPKGTHFASWVSGCKQQEISEAVFHLDESYKDLNQGKEAASLGTKDATGSQMCSRGNPGFRNDSTVSVAFHIQLSLCWMG